MFPPKGAPGSPRSMRDVRLGVGRPQPEPVDAGPAQNSCDVTLTCPKCGEQVRQSFQAEPDADDVAPDTGSPLKSDGGGPGF